MKQRLRAVRALVALGAVLGTGAPAGAEVILGLSGGFVIPGDQDITFKEYGARGELLTSVTTSNVDETVGPIVGASVTAWGDHGPLRYAALQLDALYWYVEADPAMTPPAPRLTVGQHRGGLFLSVLGRLPLYPSLGRFSPEGGDTFAYLGAGGGAVYTDVEHGNEEWGEGVQFLLGVSLPLTSRLRFRVESRYLLASDVDTASPDQGWRVDTSGSPDPPRLGPHLDTKFVPVLFGLDWRF